jgi:hypothetical protein
MARKMEMAREMGRRERERRGRGDKGGKLEIEI